MRHRSQGRLMFRTLTVALAVSLASALSGAAVAGTNTEPPLETSQAKLDAGLVCTPFTNPDKPPVLLMHATFVTGAEQYSWSYVPLLTARGFDVCIVTAPDRGLGDQQIAAEYVVNALRRIHGETGRKVAMIGHSQGASMPRWALKWWPSARDAVSDYVLLAGLNHGSTVFDAVGIAGPNPMGLPAAHWQFQTDSTFVEALNRDDETPGDISYSTIYTLFDEFVQPVVPTPTAALEFGEGNPQVVNILLQNVCPGRLVDHITIGTTDRLTFDLALDAISNPGPANFERAGGSALCGLVPIVPDQNFPPGAVGKFLTTLADEPSHGLPDLHLTAQEPTLKSYAQ